MSGSDYQEEAGISGSGKLGGGKYGVLNISGAGSVTGDVVANEVSIAGSGRFDGRLEASRLEVTGKCEVQGDLEAENIIIRGSLKAKGSLNARILKSYGTLDVSKWIKSDEVYFAGSSKVEGDVECDSFRSRGSFSIEGLLSADIIDIWLGSENYAEEIGGESIKIRKKGVSRALDEEKVRNGVESFERGMDKLGEKLGFEVSFNEEKISKGVSNLSEKVDSYLSELSKGSLKSSLIEGDKLGLEGVEAGTVRGNDISIGEDCLIDKVEFSNTLEVSEEAEVRERTEV